MIKNVKGTKLFSTCRSCEKDIEFDFKGIELKYLPEYDQYENLPIQCECGVFEIFNMNIPEDEKDEAHLADIMPEDEKIQRRFIRMLQREIRADFKKPVISGK